MTLLMILAALVAERYLLVWQDLRQPVLIGRWMQLHQSLPLPPYLRESWGGIATLLLPPLLVIGLLYLVAGSILGTLLAVLVLLYSLGPKDLDSQVQNLEAALRGGDAAQIRAASAPFLESAQDAHTDPRTGLVAGILVAALRRIFGVIAGFLLLGPVGALGYRMVRETRSLARDLDYPLLQSHLEQLLALLDWLPARGVACLFALAGNFETTLHAWRYRDRETQLDAAAALVACTGAGALQLDTGPVATPLRRWDGHESPTQAAMALVWRALIVLLALLLLVTIAYWL